ncbi:hypothetical protein ACRXB1_34670, partial [Caballeronia sp. M23-90]
MAAYILRRLLLMIPTLIGVVTLTFVVTQFVPGGPVEQMMSQLRHGNLNVLGRWLPAPASRTSNRAASPRRSTTSAGLKGTPCAP